MPTVTKTSYLAKDGSLQPVPAPYFQVGELVAIKSEPGYTGKIILISDPDTAEERYLVDCHPGAVSNYSWVWMDTPTGPNMLALNWLVRKDLKKLPKKRLKKEPTR